MEEYNHPPSASMWDEGNFTRWIEYFGLGQGLPEGEISLIPYGLTHYSLFISLFT
jgi:hypothetical protein